MSTFEFLVKNGKYSYDAIAVIMKTIIYSIHGLLTLLTTGNDGLEIETTYQNLDELIDYLLKDS